MLGASSFTYAQATWTQGLADWISGHVGAFEAIGGAILPARPRRPRDKAKVEQAVLMVERWLLGRLRHRTFHSLAEVNAAIAELMTRLNEERPIRRLGVTRRKLLEEIDRPALKALPESPYVFAEWRICRVSVDYHVEVEAHCPKEVQLPVDAGGRHVLYVARCVVTYFALAIDALVSSFAPERPFDFGMPVTKLLSWIVLIS